MLIAPLVEEGARVIYQPFVGTLELALLDLSMLAEPKRVHVELRISLLIKQGS